MQKKPKKQKQKQKTTNTESRCKKVAGPLPESLLKKDPGTNDFLIFLQKC